MHVVFFSDYPGFGGHEAMTVEAARAVASQERVTFLVNETNSALISKLEADNDDHDLSVATHQYRSKRLQEIRSALAFGARRALARTIEKMKPDVVVVVQGRIELCSLGLLAAKQAGVRCVSYLPLAHSLRVAGTRFGAEVRDLVDRLYYRTADEFITVSENMRTLLYSRGVPRSTPVSVVYNGIDVSRLHSASPDAARAKLGLPRDMRIATLAGRLSIRQKGHDVVLDALARKSPGTLDRVHVVFFGDGPDELMLKEQVQRRGLTGRVTFLPWHDNPADVYAASDVLLIPSRFEGFPIVLLEAMYRRLPVVASDVDAMAEVLPFSWRFPAGDSARLRSTLASVLEQNNGDDLDRLHRRVVDEFTVERFRQGFLRALQHPPQSNYAS